jgi:PST family polysaccharide transporter
MGLWTVRRVWAVRLFLDRQIAKHYFRFGFFVMLSRQLSFWLEQFDGFWIGTTLGDTALGFYSKAYEFARYPSRVVAAPLQGVVFSTYARLQDDRRRLSKAYYSVNGLVIRVGFLLSLGLVLVAQEFVTIFLGDKWLPMVTTFQLMVVYCLFDPLIVTAGSLATAVGHPQILTRIKVLQIAVFVPSVIILAHNFGIEGVAIAADAMVFVGVVLILHQVRPFVDFSLKKLFAVPFLALFLAAVAAIGASELLTLQDDWQILIVRAIAAGVVYAGILLVLERNEYESMIGFMLRIIRNNRKV